MKKPNRGAGENGEPTFLPEDSWMSEEYPGVWEHLTHGVWEDGTPRRTSSLTIFMDSGALKACLNDKNDGYVAFVSAESFEGLLIALEGGLRGGSLDWRKARFGGKGK